MKNTRPDSYDVHLFHEGNHFHSYQFMGSHLVKDRGRTGVRFNVWAPHAREVKIAGDFNHWQAQHHPMERVEESGLWTLFIPGLKEGQSYKYQVHTAQGEVLLKADPYAFFSEVRPRSASVIYSLAEYPWQDQDWQEQKPKDLYDRPMIIYEVHPGSWKLKDGEEFYSYRELARELVDYVVDMGFTHIELMPLAEHPFDGSWGYQATGYYSVTSRYGSPRDFMYFVDCCHQKGIGVILDWVPGHFCRDGHGLGRFDGTPLFEYADPLRGENYQWGTWNFDLGRPEVHSFLISNAIFWMDVYHLDGLRVDAVASILYRDFGREEGQWSLNQYGGRENLETIDFLKKLNTQVFTSFPRALMIAEESTQWPLVSAPVYLGGLGFNFKWNMGWMNDILRYMEMDPFFRRWHHNLLTFSLWYTYTENFILPLSHDEVVHLKKSLLSKMPGDYWQKFANLRLLLGYMLAHPGKNLLFMGGELGQFDEWQEMNELGWNLLDYPQHRSLHFYVKELNHFYQKEKPFWELDYQQEGYQWIDPHDNTQSIITFMRRDREENFLIVVCNFTPIVHGNYRIGAPQPGDYQEVFNSDWKNYGGSGQENPGLLSAQELNWHNQPCSLEIKIPPLAMIVLKRK